MKKLLFLPVSAFALYVGSPALPELPQRGRIIDPDRWYGAKVGYVGDFIFDRRLEMRKTHRDAKGFDLYSHQGILTFNASNRIEAFLSAGAAKVKLEDQSLKYTTTYGFSYGAGGRWLMLAWNPGFVLGLSVNYMRATPNMSSITQSGRSRATDGSSLHYSEWQIALALSYEAKRFSPYVGMAVSSSRSSLHDMPTGLKNDTFVSRNHTSLVLGAAYATKDTFVFSVEGRIFTEVAISGAIDYRF